jgi:hypothetical protein
MAKKAKKTVKAKKAGAKRKQTAAKSAARKKVARSKSAKVKKVSVTKTSRPAAKVSKPKPKSVAPRKQQAKNLHPGMMGDGTEEQNLNQSGTPAARITQDEIDAAFKKPS